MMMKMKWSDCRKYAFKTFVVVVISLGVFTSVVKTYQNWDDDPDRGALIMTDLQFGDHYDKIYSGLTKDENGKEVPWQGWKPEDSLWFYTTTQGSDLIPYDFYMVLQQKDSDELFRSNKNMDRYRYIPLKPTFSNPDGLALGFVKDTYQGKDFMGLTCAACHTAQINYNGVAMRIDGGPAMSDMENFVKDISAAMADTIANPEKEKRFVEAVLERNGFGQMISGGRNYSSEDEVKTDMKKYAARLLDYITINHSNLSYGYGRLDAFGRIFNRALQHVLNKKQIEKALLTVMSADETKKVLAGIPKSVVKDNDFDRIVENIKPLLTKRQMVELKNELFNRPNAPVSYPFLWDIPQHDYVQWNGIAANAGLGPIGRNTGEVIGVFGTLDWHEEEGFSLSALISGEFPFGTHVKYESSVNVNNLERMENHLRDLTSPKWPEEILGKLDQARIGRGQVLYEQRCVSCHATIKRDDPERKVIANFTSVKKAGTDPKMANNALAYTGRSGIVQDQYLDVGVGSLYMEEQMPVAALLTIATTNVVATPDPDKWWIRRGADWAYTLVSSLLDNPIKASLKRGDYEPDTTVNPFASLMAYKARPLNGIWATAPYLHNGSVPTLYDLLLPKKKKNDPADGEYRPEEFYTGSREFDPEKVGLKSQGYKGSRFLTELEGNSNAGHEYQFIGKNGKSVPLNKEDRLDLLEYLKTL